MTDSFQVFPIGYVSSCLKARSVAPRQGWEGAPEAELVVQPDFVNGLDGLESGSELWVLTWLHQSDRSILRVHPRDELTNPQTGVFATRSSDRPNPIGMHRVRIVSKTGGRIRVEPLEAIDGTPIVDIKPVIDGLDGY